MAKNSLKPNVGPTDSTSALAVGLKCFCVLCAYFLKVINLTLHSEVYFTPVHIFFMCSVLIFRDRNSISGVLSSGNDGDRGGTRSLAMLVRQ